MQETRKHEQNKADLWLKFFNKAFNNVGKGLNAIGKIIGKKGI